MRVGIICNLANGEVGGQTTKTNQIIKYLDEHFDIDVYDLWPEKSKKRMFKIFLKSIQMYRRTDSTVVILNTRGTMLVLSALKFAHIFTKKPIYEIAVGGTRQEKAKSSRYFRELEKCVTRILVETSHMAEEYHKLGLSQAEVLSNCKVMSDNPGINFDSYADRLLICTYSRIVEDKGVDTAIDVVTNLKNQGKNVTLDIYGPISSDYEEEFSKLMENSGDYINYKGVVDAGRAAETLKNYHMLLFPTRHVSEGFPGTFLDAMEAGLAIISSYNNNFTDIVKEGENGYLLKNATVDDYATKITSLIDDSDMLKQMRKTSFEYSRNYSSDVVLEKLLNYLK